MYIFGKECTFLDNMLNDFFYLELFLFVGVDKLICNINYLNCFFFRIGCNFIDFPFGTIILRIRTVFRLDAL